MHYVTVFGVSSEYVRNNFAKSLREYALVDIFYRIVYILLCGTYAAHHITVVFIHISVL